MSHDEHDDGLVHGHAWASDPEPARPQTRRPTSAVPSGHDDGLVHGHGWACGERGAPVHEASRL